MTDLPSTHIELCCVYVIGSLTNFSYMSEMLDDAKMRSGLYPSFHLALLNDFGSFALWISVKLYEFSHCSTAFP